MRERLLRFAALVTALALAAPAAGAAAQTIAAAPQTLKVASLVGEGQTVEAGDILRTTRIFPNWNLNCEVLLSRGKHLCAVELRSVDVKGQQIFTWSIALSSTGEPIMILRIPSDADRSYGLRMSIGAFTTILVPQPQDCGPAECRMIAPFETPLRTLMMSQKQIAFSLTRHGQTLKVDAPLAGMAEALDAARRDPIGLIATQQAKQAKQAKPSMAALKLRKSQKP